MLGNPIVILVGPWDDWLCLTAVALALTVECAVMDCLLRAQGRARGRLPFLFAINLVSWPIFAATLPNVWQRMEPASASLLLEGAVVLVEGSVLWTASRSRWRSEIVSQAPLSGFRALGVAFWGNLASMALGFLYVPAALKPLGLPVVIVLTGSLVFLCSGLLAVAGPTRRRHLTRNR